MKNNTLNKLQSWFQSINWLKVHKTINTGLKILLKYLDKILIVLSIAGSMLLSLIFFLINNKSKRKKSKNGTRTFN